MNRVLAAFVGAVVLLAVIAAVVVANRDMPVLDRGTPQGAVQEFLQAMFDGEHEAAAALLSPSTRCSASDLAASYSPGSSRIVLDDVTLDGDQAVVSVDVTDGSADGPFESSGYSHKERISVQREGGTWKVTAAPWLLSACDSTKGRP